MKTTWPRADIAPKINRDGQGLTYACVAAENSHISLVLHESS